MLKYAAAVLTSIELSGSIERAISKTSPALQIHPWTNSEFAYFVHAATDEESENTSSSDMAIEYPQRVSDSEPNAIEAIMMHI